MSEAQGFCEVALLDGGFLQVARADFDPLWERLQSGRGGGYLATGLDGAEIGLPLDSISYLVNVPPHLARQHQEEAERRRVTGEGG